MLAKDVMTTSVVTVSPETEVREIARLLLARRISAVPVTDAEGAVVGIVSEGDLLHRPESETETTSSWWLGLVAAPSQKAKDYVKTHGRHAADVMTRDVITVTSDVSLAAIATLLEKHRIKRVPVVDDGKLVGIVSRANLLQGLAMQETAPVSGDDEAVRQALMSELRTASVGTDYLNVVVLDGKVQIWGAVETQEEKRAVPVAVENVTGIADWEDHVRIVPPMVVRSLWA